MSENSKTVKVGLGIPWLAVAIGGLSGWIATQTGEGLIVGCLCGIVIATATYVGLVPILGVFIYSWIAGALFTWVGMDFSILFWYGMIWAIIYTAITTFVGIIVITEGIAAILNR